MSWTHPTGKSPKTVLISCLGPTKHSLLELTTAHMPPADLMAVDEVWGINGGANHFAGRVAWDVLWVLDHLHGEEAKEPEYGQHLRNWMQRFPDRPLITTEAAGSWPAQVHEYPFVEVATAVTALGGPESCWFRNSVPMIVAYAWWIGVEKIFLFGADYHHEAMKMREDDKGNAEAWVHFFRMMGGKVVLPADTTLMDANKPSYIYGFQRQPKWRDGLWTVGPSQLSTPADGGVSTNPLIPPRVQEMLQTIQKQEIARLEELERKVGDLRRRVSNGEEK